ncbi:MAG: phenylacetate-CoA oxygenase subunit PaaC [Chitinophagaceae bacterium]|nr:phenylacetate-CoA oxygenase subunit PaaC [Chitinophagaceae bacterium]
MNQKKTSYILHLADNSLILGQRNSEWCGHGPVLEQDIAITNITLDLVGQARSLYQYAASLLGEGTTEDSLAYLRTEREFLNCLLVEQPKADWAHTVLRQFFFSTYQYYLCQQLLSHPDAQLAAIAEKSLKEVRYHVRWSGEWVIRLGDGTTESKQRLQLALAALWPYTGELFMPAAYESGQGTDLSAIRPLWNEKVQAVLREATLDLPGETFMHSGGKTGVHTEHLGFILAEMQYMQRTYPGCEW